MQLQRIYFFDAPPPGTRAQRREVLGGKGAGLAEMMSDMGLPVPYGFTLPTTLCQEFATGVWPGGLQSEVHAAVTRIETRLSSRFGDASNPLFLSVRSGAAESMPGMMDTILNVGSTPGTIAALASSSSEQFATQSYVRFLKMFGRTVLGIADEELEASSSLSVAAQIEALRRSIATRLPLHELDDPWVQLERSIVAVFGSWNSARAQLYRERQGIAAKGTAATVQAMVFGNRDPDSGTGVYFTRDPNTGEPVVYGDYLACAQGEDVVAGTHQTEHLDALKRKQPGLYEQLVLIGADLERRYRDMCDIEFTIESGRLWLLQVRLAKRSAVATVKVALDLAGQGTITMREALERITPETAAAAESSLRQVSQANKPLTTGLAASPGIATGRAYFSADDAADAADRGEHVIFIAQATSPSDLHGFEAAKGILTTTGGLVSHASLVAREWGIPAVVGAAEIQLAERALRVGSVEIKQGESLTIDGATGAVFAGEVSTSGASQTPPLLIRLREFCSQSFAGSDDLTLEQFVQCAREQFLGRAV